MAKKPKTAKGQQPALHAQLEQLQAQLATKESQVTDLQTKLAEAEGQARYLQQELQTNNRLESEVQHLLQSQQEAASHFNDYENRVLALELQSMVERFRVMDVDTLSDQNHELRNEVMRLNSENMELTKALAESSQRARRDVARVQLSLETAARETLSTARDRICRELHEQMDDSMKALVEEHGHLQESTVILSQQAAALDQQYRAISNDRRQYKIDAEVGKSMNDMQSRQIVLLKHQLERFNLAIQMLKVRCEEQTQRADAAESKAAVVKQQLARMQTLTDRALSAAQSGADSSAVARLLDMNSAELEGLHDDDSLSGRLSRQVSELQSQLARCMASRDRWRERAYLYDRACAQLQAALQTLQQSSMFTKSASHNAVKAIWSSPDSRPTSAVSTDRPSPRVSPDPSRVQGELSCLSSHTPHRPSTPTTPAPTALQQNQASALCVQPAMPAAGNLVPMSRPSTARAHGPMADRRFHRPASAAAATSPQAVMAHTLSHGHAVRVHSATTRRPHSSQPPSTACLLAKPWAGDSEPTHIVTGASDLGAGTCTIECPQLARDSSTLPGTQADEDRTGVRSVSPLHDQVAVSRLQAQMPLGSQQPGLDHSAQQPGQVLGTIGTDAPNDVVQPMVLQPRQLRPGSVRYFSGARADPFLAMSELGQGLRQTAQTGHRRRPVSASPWMSASTHNFKAVDTS